MPFEGILEDLTRAAGATGAVIIDGDGEEVAHYSAVPDADMPLVGAHHGVVMNAVRGSVTGAGEMVIRASGGTVALIPIIEGCCLVVLTPGDDVTGKTLHLARAAADRIEGEL